MDLDRKITSITIDGIVDMRENPVSINEFVDMFLDWVESNNWYFGGTSSECSDGNE
jgi:hypothetical protein